MSQAQHVRPTTSQVPAEPDALARARAALEEARARVGESAAAYFAADGDDVERARQAYFDALSARADAEQALVHARWHRHV